MRLHILAEERNVRKIKLQSNLFNRLIRILQQANDVLHHKFVYNVTGRLSAHRLAYGRQILGAYIQLIGIVINKSRFIAYKIDLTSVEQVKSEIEKLKKEHKKANHVCYAYVYSREVVAEKCSDDGEPKGTAGYPILNVIKMKKLNKQKKELKT